MLHKYANAGKAILLWLANVLLFILIIISNNYAAALMSTLE